MIMASVDWLFPRAGHHCFRVPRSSGCAQLEPPQSGRCVPSWLVAEGIKLVWG